MRKKARFSFGRDHLVVLQATSSSRPTATKTLDRMHDTELGKNPEITRFKGLGEISPDEFKHFIGEEMRLEPVVIGKDKSVHELLKFYMGKNTPDRQEFIIENLKIEQDLVDDAAA